MSLCLDLLETIRADVMLHSSSSHYCGKKEKTTIVTATGDVKLQLQ